MNDNLIELFPDMASQVELMSIDELARELIRVMKDSGEGMDPALADELHVLLPPDRFR